jgi:ribonuclease P protein component
MFSKSHRFHGYGSLRAVYQHGRTIRGGLCSLKYIDRPAGKPYRVAVVVSRKVSKSAVTRNRIRRRLYEALRQRESRLMGRDIVITAFSEQLATMEAEKLRQTVDELLDKAGL